MESKICPLTGKTKSSCPCRTCSGKGEKSKSRSLSSSSLSSELSMKPKGEGRWGGTYHFNVPEFMPLYLSSDMDAEDSPWKKPRLVAGDDHSENKGGIELLEARRHVGKLGAEARGVASSGVGGVGGGVGVGGGGSGVADGGGRTEKKRFGFQTESIPGSKKSPSRRISISEDPSHNNNNNNSDSNSDSNSGNCSSTDSDVTLPDLPQPTDLMDDSEGEGQGWRSDKVKWETVGNPARDGNPPLSSDDIEDLPDSEALFTYSQEDAVILISDDDEEDEADNNNNNYDDAHDDDDDEEEDNDDEENDEEDDDKGNDDDDDDENKRVGGKVGGRGTDKRYRRSPKKVRRFADVSFDNDNDNNNNNNGNGNRFIKEEPDDFFCREIKKEIPDPMEGFFDGAANSSKNGRQTNASLRDSTEAQQRRSSTDADDQSSRSKEPGRPKLGRGVKIKEEKSSSEESVLLFEDSGEELTMESSDGAKKKNKMMMTTTKKNAFMVKEENNCDEELVLSPHSLTNTREFSSSFKSSSCRSYYTVLPKVTKTVSEWLTAQKHNLDLSRGDENEAVDNFSDADDEELYMCATQVEDSLFSNNNNSSSSSSSSKTNSKDPRESQLCNGPSTKKAPKSATTTTPTPPPLTSSSSSTTTTTKVPKTSPSNDVDGYFSKTPVVKSSACKMFRKARTSTPSATSSLPPPLSMSTVKDKTRRRGVWGREEEENSDSDGTYSVATQIDRPVISARDIEDDVDEEEEGVQDDNNHHHHNNNNNIDDEDSDSYIACTQIDSAPRKPKRPDRRIKSKLVHSVLTINKPPRRGTEDSGDDSDDSLFSIATQVDAILSSTDNPRPWNNSNSSLFPKVSNSVPNTDSAFHPENSEFKTPKFPHRKKAFQWIRPGGETSVARDHRRAVRPRDDSEDDCEEYIIPASKKRQGKPVFGRVSTASPFVEISDSDSDDSVFSMATQHDSTTATPYRNDAKHVGDDDVNDDINVDDDDDDDEPFVVATQVDKTLELHSKSKPSSDHSFKIPMQPPKKLPQAPLRAKDLRLFKYTNDEDDDPYDSDDSQFSVATQLDVLPQPRGSNRGSKDQDLYLCDTQLDEGFVSPCKVKSDADDDAYTDDDDDDAFGSATQVDLVDSCKESSSKDKESPYSDFIFAIAATEPSHIPPQDGGTTHRRDADVDSRDGRQKQQQHTTTATANASSKFASFMLGLGENSESGDDGKSSVTNVTKTSEIPPQRLKSRKEMRDSFRAKERSKSDRKNSSSGNNNNNSNPGKSPLNIFNSPAKLSVMESSTGPRKKRHRSPKWKKESRQKAKVIKDGIFSAKSRLEERFLMKSYDKTPARWTKTSRVIVGSSTNSSDVPLPNADQIKKLGLPLIETPKRRRSLPETLIKNHPEERLDTSRASSPVLDTSMSGNTAPNTPSPKRTSTTSPTPTSTTTNPLKTCYNISSHQSKTQPHSTTKSTQRVPLYENMGKCFAKDFNSFHIPKIKNSSPKTSPSDPTQTRPGSSLQDKPYSSCSTIQDLLYEVSLSKPSHNKPVISCDKTKPSNPKPVCPKQTLLCDIPLPKPPYSKPISPCDIPLPKSPNPNPDLSKPSQYKPLIPCDIPLPKPSNLKSYDIPTCKLCNIPNCNTSHTKHILLGSVPNYVPSSHKSSLRSNLVNTRQTSADTNPKKTVSFANKPVSMSVISAPPPLGGPCQPSRANNRHSDLLKHLLRWNTKWLQEQSKLQITPPVVSPDQLFPLLQSYLSYTDYFNIIRPLLLLEVWACVHKDYTEVERSVRSWQVACCNVCKTSPSEVDYIIYGVMSESDQMTNNYLMEGDCVILELPVTDLGVSGDGDGGGQAAPTQYPVFGFVVKVNIQKPPQQSEVFQVFPDLGVLSSAMNNAKVFRAVIKCHYRKLSHCFTKLMKVQHVTNLTPFLRQYQALTKFVSNPLHSFILNPAGGGALVTGSSVSIDGNYNDSQKRAIAAAVEMAFQPQIKPSLCLVQGPPGTGKSHTIIGMIEKVKEKKPQSKIMLCAPSNGAIDELMRRLIDYKEKTPANQRVPLRFVRIGNTKSIHKDVVKYSLDELILLNLKQHGQKEPNLMNEINRYNVKLKQSQSEIERMRSGEKTSLRDEKIRKLQKDLRYIKTKIDLLVKQLHNHRAASSHPECSSPERATMRRSLLSKADVICGTLSACGSNCFLSDLANEYFTCVIVDEASQCCELDNLIPLQYNCNKMILIGDTEQLSPTVISQRAEEYNYGQSLFERLCKHYQQQKVQQDAVILLNVQYRMHPDICKFPNRYIYDNQLVSYSKLLTRSDTVPIAPYLLFDAQFGSHYRSADSGSLKNPLEADITVCLCECLSQVSSEPSLSIAVIAPYREQKRLLENRLLHRKLYNVDVTTVDGFQGRENDIIIMSCVRANTGFGNIGFLKDRRRLNVALTRAKFALYIVGHLSSLEGDEDWKSLIQDAQDRHLVLRVGRLDQFESVVKKCILTS